MYQKNKKVLADTTLRGRSLFEEETYPQVEVVGQLYSGILESVSPQDGEQFTLKKTRADTYFPMNTEEVAFAKKN